MSTGLEPEPKPLFILAGQIKTPPFSAEARREAGSFLRIVQDGGSVSMPHSRPMPSIGPRCHELRIRDQSVNWRIFYRIDADAVVVAEIFEKKTPKTPKQIIDLCKKRLRDYDSE
jgi:phage-related protein